MTLARFRPPKGVRDLTGPYPVPGAKGRQRYAEPGKNRFDDRREGDHPPHRKSAAEEAGLSDHQRKTALRIANVPEGEFEAAVESDVGGGYNGPSPAACVPFREGDADRHTVEPCRRDSGGVCNSCVIAHGKPAKKRDVSVRGLTV
jgi:hypothetical protein